MDTTLSDEEIDLITDKEMLSYKSIRHCVSHAIEIIDDGIKSKKL
jgi:hypothetical protein